MARKILVAEDDYATSKMVATALKTAGYEPTVARSCHQARELMEAGEFELILCDLYLGDGTGLELLHEKKTQSTAPPFVMFTAKGSVEAAVEAMRDGAFDFLAKPFRVKDLLLLTERALASRDIPKASAEHDSHGIESSLMIGTSPAMVELYKKIALVAPTDTPVLLVGETGTGKELVARCLHNFNARKERPFVCVNCGALTENLLESELFGHERGAFTGAMTSRRGLFEVSSGGTLFLDEIAETSQAFQVKLLRVLQEGELRPVGSNRVVRVDVRVVAATNGNLKEKISEGQFRQDLYYRLGVVQLELPPLRQRRQDIPQLVRYFLSRLSSRLKRRVQISDSALHALAGYSWPGNVRELENLLERAVVLKTGSLIEEEDLDFQKPGPETEIESSCQLSELEILERNKIGSVLVETRGNKSEAARRLGIERKTLYRKAQRLGIDLDSHYQK